MAGQSDKKKENQKQVQQELEIRKGARLKPENKKNGNADKDTKGREQEGSIKNSK